MKGLWGHINKTNKFNHFDICCHGNGLLCVLWHFQPFLGRKLLKLPLKRMIYILRIWSRIKILKASSQSVNLALYKQCKINFTGFHLVAFLHLATLLVSSNWKTGKFSLFLTYWKSTCQGKHNFFLLLGNVLDLTPINYDQNTLGYCFSKKGCCQKIVHFYQKCQFCLY